MNAQYSFVVSHVVHRGVSRGATVDTFSCYCKIFQIVILHTYVKLLLSSWPSRDASVNHMTDNDLPQAQESTVCRAATVNGVVSVSKKLWFRGYFKDAVPQFIVSPKHDHQAL